MVTVQVEIFVDEHGNIRGSIDGAEACNDIDCDEAVRRINFDVQIPLPVATKQVIEIPTQDDSPIAITKGD